MSQNSLTISAAQAGTPFAAAISGALDTLRTQSSGTTAPSSPTAGQWWLDTAANPWILKIRTPDGSAWASVLTIAATGNSLNFSGFDAHAKVKSNLAATAAPSTTDDSASGYAVGSIWVDVTNDSVYICVDSTATAAVWKTCSIDATVAKVNQTNDFTAQQRVTPAALTDAPSISWNLNTHQVATLTIGGVRILSNPTNMKSGSFYTIIVKQDSTGGRTLAFDSAYKFEGGITPVLSTAAGAVDILSFVSDGTYMYGSLGKGFA